MTEIKNCTFTSKLDLFIEYVESEYSSGKAQLVSDILNADEQTIKRIVIELEKK